MVIKMLAVINGTLITPEGPVLSDLRIQDGVITQIGTAQPGDETYDASGCLVFPGFIDAHTHLEMDTGTAMTADDFPSGTAAALSGGTTTILDFATQSKGGTLKQALEAWHGRADGRSSCNYGFHMAVTDWNEQTRSELADMIGEGVTSFKAYMAYDNLRLTDSELSEFILRAKELHGIVGVHCELGDEVNKSVKKLLAEGKTGPEYHPLSRPNAVEAGAVEKLLKIARPNNAPVWVVHLSARESLALVTRWRERGVKALVETCPQYLTLSDGEYARENFQGAKFVCSPPLRSKRDVNALWRGLSSGEIDIVSTDHCSFTFEQKKQGIGDFSKIPNGLPGIEHRPALLWSYGVGRGGLDEAAFLRLLSENPARAFGMFPEKGALRPGSDADVVVWDPGYKGRLTADSQIQKSGYSPWEGVQLTGRARAVFLGGRLCAENGRVIEPGRGRFVRRRAVW